MPQSWIILIIVSIATFPTLARCNESDQNHLVVCAVPDAMPRTSRAADGSPQGLDVAVAQLVARALGRGIEFHWCTSAACSWNSVSAHRCGIVIGQPHGSGPSHELAWSIPYAGSRFGLVVHQDTKDILSHTDLGGKRAGVVSGTVAPSAKGLSTIQFKTRRALLHGFVANKLDAAFVDDDYAAWYLREHPTLPLRRVAEYVPRERWNIGFAVRANEKALLAEINQVLRQLLRSGEVNKAFTDQGVSYRAPFSTSDRRSAGYNTWKQIRERGELVVSLDPANLPYSSADKNRPGFDVELARELARKLGVKLRINWIDVQRETAIGELLDQECDLAFGAAIDSGAMDDDQELASKVIYSRPYYGTGYLLVIRKNGPRVRSLAELKGQQSRRIGTEAGSVADYHLRQRGYLRRLFRTQLSVLKALHDGEIDYAYLWANVGWTLQASPEFSLELVPNYVPEDHWNIAIAIRRGDKELKRHVDAAVDTLVKSGAVSRALARYHVPYFQEFTKKKEPRKQKQKVDSVSGQMSRNDVLQHQPTNRGIEPQLHQRQRSKRGYTCLERIRSSGVLVVGLDHKNLPFSTAHTEPAGLDYEIAELLAENLGVSLRVYWAYSSHESYPSKLVSKRFCDVILGVMPDDRFASRVLYSKPYYFADYRLVVPVDSGIPSGSLLLAAERGVAVRGLRESKVQEYPSLQCVLEAVASGKERAGYVIATRGRWLAEKHWPGKLKFVGKGAGSIDCFPVCAAVRKTDSDLKTAIDEALTKMAESGKLAEVFNRWQIPYKSSKK